MRTCASMKHMPMKHKIWLAIVLLPMVALSQDLTPAEAADQALRARATQFMQYHVDGNFRKAYDMVAEDTKEEYFNSGKSQLESFKIDAIRFTDNFTKATVSATLSKTAAILGQPFPLTMASESTWKIENGKWVWYNDLKDSAVSPFVPVPSPSSANASPAAADPRTNGPGDVGLPKDFDPKTIAAAAQDILQQVGVDRKEVTLATNRPSDDKVVFHNGMTGSVQLELSGPEIPGFTAKVEQSNVRPGGDAAVVFHYEPNDPAARRDPITVQLVVQPLNQPFAIQVNFTAAGPVTPK